MVDLRFEGGVGTLLEGMGIGLDQLEVVQTDAGPVVLAVSGREGGVVCVGFDSAGRPQILEQRYFEDGMLNAADGRLSVVEVDGEIIVLTGAQGSNTLVGYQLETGGLGAVRSLEGRDAAGARDTLVSQTDNGFIFSAASDGSLRCFRGGQNGTLNEGAVIWDHPGTFHGLPTALESVSVQGKTYLLTLDARTPGVSVFSVDNANGTLTEAASMGTSLGLGLYETPTGLETTQIGGTTYVIVASRGETTQGAALSVMELTANGDLVITDHILDNLSTRFGAVSEVSVVEHGGFSYVLAGGGDQGVDMFTLMPNGMLVHLDTITTEVGASLDSLSDLTAVVVGDQLNLLTTSHQREEITALSADLSQQGQVRQAGDTGTVLGGGAFNDMLVGGRGRDTISGGAGDDIIYDGAGADVLTGGLGADRFVLSFDGANDTITDFRHREDTLDLSHTPMLYSVDQITVTSYAWGAMLSFRGQQLEVRSPGGWVSLEDIVRATDFTIDRPPLAVRNEVVGNSGSETLEGSDSGDVIRGEGGSDLIFGGAGDDDISGGTREDTVHAGAGNDTVEGGGGADEVYLDEGHDVYLDGTNGNAPSNDLVFGGLGNDTITSIAGNDELHGGAGNDSLVGGSGADLIYGGIHFDWISGGAGNDTVFGGDGRDTAYLGTGDDLFHDNAQGGALGSDTVFAGAGNDTIRGGNGNDRFFGEDGNDLIYAGTGNDSVYGGRNDDEIHAGVGHDLVFGGDGRDLVFLNQGNDLFIDTGQGGEFGRDTVFAGFGNDTIEGGNGDDEFHGEWGNDLIHARLGNDSIYAGDGNDSVYGGNGRDLAYLGAGNDIYYDTPEGGEQGRDTVFAGLGHDTIEGGNGDDEFHGGQGNDLIHARLGNDSVYAGSGNDSVYGGDGRDLVFLGDGDDIFFDTSQGGAAGRDTVNTGAGNDTVEGGNGDDVFFGDLGNDMIRARLGNDEVYGGDGFDFIDTGDGNDLAVGGNGRDRVFLGQGDDRYVDTNQTGELGRDTITGGAGADTFEFGPGISNDVITDFELGVDTILLDRALTEGLWSFGVVRDLARVTDEGVLIEFSDGQSLLLEDVTTLNGLAGDIDTFSS